MVVELPHCLHRLSMSGSLAEPHPRARTREGLVTAGIHYVMQGYITE